MSDSEIADVCFVLEGTYPYVKGGVSTWTHRLIVSSPDLTFSLLCLLPSRKVWKPVYELPSNIIAVKIVYLDEIALGITSGLRNTKLDRQMNQDIPNIIFNGDIQALRRHIKTIHQYKLGARYLINSKFAWTLVEKIYNELAEGTDFTSFLWNWRSILTNFYAILTVKVPRAKCYHSASTGYAGLMAANAHIQTNRPAMVTEHGIYTNERRIEIFTAEWLYDPLAADRRYRKKDIDLRDIWLATFKGYSKLCYAACEDIITLYDKNQIMQRRDGAMRHKSYVVPNGIDFEKFSSIKRVKQARPTIALIGRVVPIKDIKNYLRAVDHIRCRIPNIKAYVLGPRDEEPEYDAECLELVKKLKLDKYITFTGTVDIVDYLGEIDINILTSVSEAQPLTVLEAGAAGVPSVCTDVGCCRDLVYGRSDEVPALGAGGAVVEGGNAIKIAEAVIDLLESPEKLKRANKVMRLRVEKYYNLRDVMDIYQRLYKARGQSLVEKRRL